MSIAAIDVEEYWTMGGLSKTIYEEYAEEIIYLLIKKGILIETDDANQ